MEDLVETWQTFRKNFTVQWVPTSKELQLFVEAILPLDFMKIVTDWIKASGKNTPVLRKKEDLQLESLPRINCMYLVEMVDIHTKNERR